MGPLALYCALFALPLLWGTAEAAPSSTSQPNESSTSTPVEQPTDSGICGQRSNEVLKKITNWQQNGYKPEYEEEYKQLKDRCSRVHEERKAKVAEINNKLHESTMGIQVSMNQMAVSVKTELSTMEQLVLTQHEQLVAAWEYGVQLQNELLLTNVESDRIDRALMYHSIAPNSSVQEIVKNSYAYHGSNGRKVALLLKFTRALPVQDERTQAYGVLEQQLKSNGQHERFPAIIYSQDVKDFGKKEEPAPLQKSTIDRWQELLRAGNFTEVVFFANDYPDYYERVEKDILDALAGNWSESALDHMVYLPNALPQPRQRVSALKTILETLQNHQNEQFIDVYLMRLASELQKLDKDLSADSNAAQAKAELTTVRDLFTKFTYQRSFQSYVYLFGKLLSTI